MPLTRSSGATASIADPGPWYASILACPDCGTDLTQRGGTDLWCALCVRAIRLVPNADLRPTRARARSLDLPVSVDVEHYLAGIDLSPPAETYTGPSGQRDATALLSVLQQTVRGAGQVLDLGCGPRDQAPGVASLGHAYVGVDFSSSAADMLADAHALPFASESFDFVLSYAVLEHLHNPFLAMREVARVLKPGAVMCGTVSQGEPFHESCFHHTVWGLLSVCLASRFEVSRLWACWDTLEGLGSMGRYPRAIRAGLRFLGAVNARVPILSPRKMRWPARDRALDRLHRAASIGFVIRKTTA